MFNIFKKKPTNNKALFLQELAKGFGRWSAANEKEYAEAYRLLINRFTMDEPKTEEQK